MKILPEWQEMLEPKEFKGLQDENKRAMVIVEQRVQETNVSLCTQT